LAGCAVSRDPRLEHRDWVLSGDPSKRALDRLAALVAPEAVVVRDGADRRVPVDKVVVGDLVRLSAGDQVVADERLVSADRLALDESNLTGESELAVRGTRDEVWSGSFAVD
jgi:cation-transporting P-type ATPase E